MVDAPMPKPPMKRKKAKEVRVVDQGRTERADDIQRADDNQRFFTPEFIGRYAAKERTDDRPPKRR